MNRHSLKCRLVSERGEAAESRHSSAPHPDSCSDNFKLGLFRDFFSLKLDFSSSSHLLLKEYGHVSAT